jgi:ABC-type Fe3+-siderophore transport system permease subunit
MMQSWNLISGSLPILPDCFTTIVKLCSNHQQSVVVILAFWKASNNFVFSINPLFLSGCMVHEAHYLEKSFLNYMICTAWEAVGDYNSSWSAWRLEIAYLVFTLKQKNTNVFWIMCRWLNLSWREQCILFPCFFVSAVFLFKEMK